MFQRKSLPAGEVFPKNLNVRIPENGRMSSAMVEGWVKTVRQRHAGALLCGGVELVVLDSYHGHWTNVNTVLSQSGTDIAIIPEGTTAILH